MNLLVTRNGSINHAEKDSPSYNNDTSVSIDKDMNEEVKEVAITILKRVQSPLKIIC